MKEQISASILSANMTCLGEEVEKVITAGADRIHVDVMDQHYVPNLTFGPLVLSALKKRIPQAFYEVHLMTHHIDALIESFSQAGADLILFHPEINPHTHRSLQLIHSLNCKAGVVINPGLPLDYIKPVIDIIDYLLIMTVNPGFGGQSFIPEVLDTVRQAKQMIGSRHVRLAVDGGINQHTIKAAQQAGADTFISGSYIFNAPNYESAIDSMRNQLFAPH